MNVAIIVVVHVALVAVNVVEVVYTVDSNVFLYYDDDVFALYPSFYSAVIIIITTIIISYQPSSSPVSPIIIHQSTAISHQSSS